ncbi:regulatory protein RecX [Bowmanella dokdonensis]|uniref:Regulatory protein RecX n=1 Tax=Bowmanella dokdonensis TaxID=751969 RepID=A0A939DQZ2_9ALTE|nr:regulatory protein RecX [Bowmanella dokdonensis]MBN7827063.1 regulatory protein RecX [Bowmanella dokdonensis]
MTDSDRKIIRETLASLLARREHSQAELMQKLVAKGLDGTLCQELIQEYAQRDWQSDRRFAEGFVRQRIAKGQGEVRIRAELRQRKICDGQIQQALQAVPVDWYELARGLYQKKYTQPARDWKEQQKRARYLQYKGFTSEQIRYACDWESGE